MADLMQALIGTWFVCNTTFPMWLKGDKTNPTFTYSLTDKKAGANVLLDEVNYLKRGKLKTLTGYDYQDTKALSTFVWRGKGLLSLVRSTWQVALLDPGEQWAVIWFSKTLFTPEGVDIISRTPQLSMDTLSQIKTLLANDSRLKNHLPNLRTLQ